MHKTLRTEDGFTFVEIVLVILVVVVIGASLAFLYHRQMAVKNAQSAAKSTATSTNQSSPDFFSCVSGNGILAQHGSAVCTLHGRAYIFPATFSTEDIQNFSKVPVAAQPMIESLAQKNFSGFSGCIKDSPTPGDAQGLYPYVAISIVNREFISAYVSSCDNAYGEDYNLQGSKWVDLGVEQPVFTNDPTSMNYGGNGLACSFDTKYGITKSSVLIDNPANNSQLIGYDHCVTVSGTVLPLAN